MGFNVASLVVLVINILYSCKNLIREVGYSKYAKASPGFLNSPTSKISKLFFY